MDASAVRDILHDGSVIVPLVVGLLSLALLLSIAAWPGWWRQARGASVKVHSCRDAKVVTEPPAAEQNDAAVLEQVVVVKEEPVARPEKPTGPLDPTTLVVERPIGSGGQGGVWLCADPVSGCRLALKQVHKGRLASLKKAGKVAPQDCQWLVERDALQACGDHPFITTCYAAFQDPQSLFFALELCTGGKWLRPRRPPPRAAPCLHSSRARFRFVPRTSIDGACP